MSDLERALRTALARRGLTLRSAELIPHVDLDGFTALVLHFEGREPVFDVFSGALDFGDERDAEDWAYIRYGPAIRSEAEALVAERTG